LPELRQPSGEEETFNLCFAGERKLIFVWLSIFVCGVLRQRQHLRDFSVAGRAPGQLLQGEPVLYAGLAFFDSFISLIKWGQFQPSGRGCHV
jgi:hypothetical protein